MASATQMPDLTGLNKAQQLDALRRRMAAIPGKSEHAPVESVAPTQSDAVEPSISSTVVETTALTGSLSTKKLGTIPTPPPVGDLLPRGALTRGTALSVTGSGSILIALVAAATAAGHHVAVIGLPRFGVLAVHEHGGDLSRVALVDPGKEADPLDAASICLDGIDVVVTTLGGRDVPPTRARALLARCRTHASLLISADGRMPGVDLTIDSKILACDGIGQGRGRLRSMTFETTVRGRGTPERIGHHTLSASIFGDAALRWSRAADQVVEADRPQRLAVAQ